MSELVSRRFEVIDELCRLVECRVAARVLLEGGVDPGFGEPESQEICRVDVADDAVVECAQSVEITPDGAGRVAWCEPSGGVRRIIERGAGRSRHVRFHDLPAGTARASGRDDCDNDRRGENGVATHLSSMPGTSIHEDVSDGSVSSGAMNPVPPSPSASTPADILRPHAEDQYADELRALAQLDDRERPPGWKLSPWAVVRYLLGGALSDGTVVAPKYVGRQRLVEIAVATLATDRALLLLGVPGTAKTWVSEHLAAAISGDSTLLVQGTAGTTEETLRYGWNYARLLAEGPSTAALVPGPVYRGMERGAIVRVEELTRMPAEVQDALVTVLSEKVLPVPELDTEIAAIRGFNVIATANDRDRGVNDLSSALRRRFNTVVLPLPATVDEEIDIVRRRVDELGVALALPEVPAAADEIRRVVTVFRELRSGLTEDERTSLKVPTGTLSTAEAISVVTNGIALAAHFGDGRLRPTDVAAGIVGAVVSDPVHDSVAWREYLEAVVRDRDGWGDFYEACRALDS